MSYINNSHTKFISLPNGNYKIEVEREKNWNKAVQEVLDERKELLDRLKGT